MNDSPRTPLGGDQIHNERLITGYPRLSQFLTDKGFPLSVSSLQKLGMPSAGGLGPPVEGYWGNLPAFRPSRALEWARSRIRRTRGKAAAPAPIADPPVKKAFHGPTCESPEPSPQPQHATTADTVA